MSGFLFPGPDLAVTTPFDARGRVDLDAFEARETWRTPRAVLGDLLVREREAVPA